MPIDDRPGRTYRDTPRFRNAAKSLGARVRKLRQDRGLSLYALSAASQVELSHLQRLERGQLNVTLATLLRIADGLDVPLVALVQDVERMARRKTLTRP